MPKGSGEGGGHQHNGRAPQAMQYLGRPGNEEVTNEGDYTMPLTAVTIDTVNQYGPTYWQVFGACLAAMATFYAIWWGWDYLADWWRDRRDAREGAQTEESAKIRKYIAERPATWNHERVWFTTAGGRLHVAGCRYLTGPDGEDRGRPWPWADTLPEALHYAAEQNLTACKTCNPLHADTVADVLRDRADAHLHLDEVPS